MKARWPRKTNAELNFGTPLTRPDPPLAPFCPLDPEPPFRRRDPLMNFRLSGAPAQADEPKQRSTAWEGKKR